MVLEKNLSNTHFKTYSVNMDAYSTLTYKLTEKYANNKHISKKVVYNMKRILKIKISI